MAARALPLWRRAERMQSWETRMGRSLRVAGLARAGVVAFFSNFGSMTGSSSA